MSDNHARERGDSFGAEFVDLRDVKFTPELLQCIPASYVRSYRVLPIFYRPQQLGIALDDPAKLDVISELSFMHRRDIEARIADPLQLDEFIERLYGVSET